MISGLLQPISIETDAHVVNDFVRRCVVDVKCLSRLRGVVAEAYKGIMIDGIPKIVEARTELHLRNLISHCIIWLDDNIVVAEVHRLPVSVLTRGDGNVKQQAMDEDSAPDFCRLPLQSCAKCQIGETVDGCRRTMGEGGVEMHPRLQGFK